jgi:sodium-independent sulfate anion transporter 11
MASRSTKVGHALAKVLRIDLQAAHPPMPAENEITRGESVYSYRSESYIEPEPTVAEYFHDLLPSGGEVLRQIAGFFPFLQWIGRYNLKWLWGDLIAGITVGAVVVPQGSA